MRFSFDYDSFKRGIPRFALSYDNSRVKGDNMKNNQKIIAFIAAAVCAVSFASCGKLAQEQTEPEKANDTLVVGINSFEGQFSPFYAKNAADTDVCALTSVPLLTTCLLYTSRAGFLSSFLEPHRKLYLRAALYVSAHKPVRFLF